MKKLIMLFAAVFAISASSFAQVKTAPTQVKPAVIKTEKQIPSDMRTPSRPEVRTQKIVDRINQRLVEKDASLALSAEQRKELVKIHMEKQLVQTSRPKLETEEDKIAFRESRKKASKEFKEKIRSVMTPEQYVVYTDVKRDRKAMRKSKTMVKDPKTLKKADKPADLNKTKKF